MRWPKPISVTPLPKASSNQASARESSPISSSMSSTGPGAPPCNGPLSAQSAANTAEIRPARVEGRGVEAVVGDGGEIGIERLLEHHAGTLAADHAQEILRRRELRIGRD